MATKQISRNTSSGSPLKFSGSYPGWRVQIKGNSLESYPGWKLQIDDSAKV